MRLLATADLHYNHPKSRRLADDLIDHIKAAAPDAVLLVGDTAASVGDDLERCLARFDDLQAAKLFVPGNHELWTHGDDSYRLFIDELPRRVRGAGWQWLQTDPFVTPSLAIVGSVGWYDYSFAPPHLGIPLRFYEHKISPGAASFSAEHRYLLGQDDDIPPHAREIYARWNDGRFAKLHRSDGQFLTELIAQLTRQLESLRHIPHVLVATHHLPFREMLPPSNAAQWQFVRAFLGSEQFGQTLLQYPNVKTLICGHSHLPLDTHVHHIHAINIGSGYRTKTYRILDLG